MVYKRRKVVKTLTGEVKVSSENSALMKEEYEKSLLLHIYRENKLKKPQSEEGINNGKWF